MGQTRGGFTSGTTKRKVQSPATTTVTSSRIRSRNSSTTFADGASSGPPSQRLLARPQGEGDEGRWRVGEPEGGGRKKTASPAEESCWRFLPAPSDSLVNPLQKARSKRRRVHLSF